MVTTATSVDWVSVETEVEALVLEYSWIKEYSPRFNVRFRDDKSYPYLAITMNDEFPRVSVVREAKRKGTKYFGPYAHAWAVRATLDELIRVFPVRSCRDGTFKQAQHSGRACLLGYIDKCSAPCVGKISESDYLVLVNDLIRFLSGQSTAFAKVVQARMKEASDNQDYESAAKWRDRAQALERVLEQNAVVVEDHTDADLIAMDFQELDIGVQIFHVRNGRITGQRFMALERSEDLSDAGYAERVVTRIYSEAVHSGIPKEVLLSTEPSNVAVIHQWLSGLRGSAVDLRVPQRGDKKSLMFTALENAHQALSRHQVERGSDITVRTQSLNSLQELLNLEEPPLRIECIDVSTLQGSDTVASLVVFEDALPKKKDYRSFIIKGDQTDDLSAVREVVTRRFAHVESEIDGVRKFAYSPNLLVIDGAQGQVQAASSALRELGLTVHVIGLAKRLEEVWVQDSSEPLILPRNSPALHLLQRVRDEAHRTAIAFHRKRRGKRAITSDLDDIPGLGDVRKKALLANFSSVADIRQATVEELVKAPGIGPSLAETIYAHLHKPKVLD
jgi:excinuclease ABC subunit C